MIATLKKIQVITGKKHAGSNEDKYVAITFDFLTKREGVQ